MLPKTVYAFRGVRALCDAEGSIQYKLIIEDLAK